MLYVQIILTLIFVYLVLIRRLLSALNDNYVEAENRHLPAERRMDDKMSNIYSKLDKIHFILEKNINEQK